MYDAIDDPYTYENSTVLVNKLDLREQAELDAFEAEISSARADEPLPEGNQGRTFFLAELNVIHAFREGNGRSQLTFFALLADYAGHPIDLDKLDPEKMLAAMIASFDGDERDLASVIKHLVS
jgi:fido (protein-threonine AMPylation protein)